MKINYNEINKYLKLNKLLYNSYSEIFTRL
jgi:hypothetical protein